MSLGGVGGGEFRERENDPDSPWNQGKGWEGVHMEKRIASDEGVCFLSWQRQQTVGGTEQGGARIPRA